MANVHLLQYFDIYRRDFTQNFFIHSKKYNADYNILKNSIREQHTKISLRNLLPAGGKKAYGNGASDSTKTSPA